MRTQSLRGQPGIPVGLEDAPEPGDVRLQRGLDARRWVVPPDLGDELLDRNGTSFGGDQLCQQRLGLRPTEVDRSLVHDHLQVAQHPNAHPPSV